MAYIIVHSLQRILQLFRRIVLADRQEEPFQAPSFSSVLGEQKEPWKTITIITNTLHEYKNPTNESASSHENQ